MSLFVLPVSRGARIARVLAILALDLVLAGAGVAMIVAYAHARDRAAGPAPAETTPAGPVSSSARSARPAQSPARVPVGVSAGDDDDAGDDDARAAGPLAAAPAPASHEQKSGRGEMAGSPVSAPGEPARARFAEPPRARPSRRASTPAASDPPPRENRAAPPRTPSRDHRDHANSSRPSPRDPESGAPGDDEVSRMTRQVALVVSRNQAQLQRCYRRAAKRATPDQPLEGRLDVHLTITPAGRASPVRVENNATGSDSLATCVTRLFSGWTFPPAPHGQSLDLIWPLRFRAPK